MLAVSYGEGMSIIYKEVRGPENSFQLVFEAYDGHFEEVGKIDEPGYTEAREDFGHLETSFAVIYLDFI